MKCCNKWKHPKIECVRVKGDKEILIANEKDIRFCPECGARLGREE